MAPSGSQNPADRRSAGSAEQNRIGPIEQNRRIGYGCPPPPGCHDLAAIEPVTSTLRSIIMGNYVFAYTGGSIAEDEAAQNAAMQAWGEWFGALGEAVVDFGGPFAGSATVGSGGVEEGGASLLTGYSIVTADSLEAAIALAQGSPVLSTGGNVEVYEVISMA
jgi:YCII-related domain